MNIKFFEKKRLKLIQNVKIDIKNEVDKTSFRLKLISLTSYFSFKTFLID